jgi:hypothetical protein
MKKKEDKETVARKAKKKDMMKDWPEKDRSNMDMGPGIEDLVKQTKKIKTVGGYSSHGKTQYEK